MKLLVIDDSELIRTRLVELLAAIPGVLQIRTAQSLAEGLKQVETDPPTLLILDLHLPDGHALEVLARFKQLAPDMTLAVLTNDVSRYNRDLSLTLGADAFFDKSRDIGHVLHWVRNEAARA